MALPPFCQRDGNDLLIHLRVIPRAPRTGVDGIRHDRLLVRLKAPPTAGKANTELVRWLAGEVGLGRGQVQLEHGERGRDKRLRLRDCERLPASWQTLRAS